MHVPEVRAIREDGWGLWPASAGGSSHRSGSPCWGFGFKPRRQEQKLQRAPAQGHPQSKAGGDFPNQLQFLSQPQPPALCPSPGRCGMMRFSALMSPDSMGNISFSVFCRAGPGRAVRTVQGPLRGTLPAAHPLLAAPHGSTPGETSPGSMGPAAPPFKA